MRLRLPGFISLGLILSCHSVLPVSFLSPGEIPEFTKQAQSLIPDLNEPAPAYPPLFRAYFRYYNLDFPGITHHYGALSSRGLPVTVHVFSPPSSSQTVFLCHGYLVHAASYSDLTETLLEAGYTVVSFDLPGHGFSGGRRGHIDSFADYATLIKDLLRQLEGKVPPCQGIIGLSTGSAAILEYLRTHDSPFRHHILGAPLIRSDKWYLSKTGFFLFGWLIRSVKTMDRDTTSDREARLFLREKDPLKLKEVPLSWVKALYAWNEELEKEKILTDRKVVVIQGDKDIVVHWKYNLAFLSARIPRLEIKRIPGGKHELYLESAPIRRQVFSLILAELASPP